MFGWWSSVKYAVRASTRVGQNAPVGNKKRYLGWVEKLQHDNGFIVFCHDEYKNIYFHTADLQTCGEKKVREGCLLEFSIGNASDSKRKQPKNRRNNYNSLCALNISRQEGKPIVYETGKIGSMLAKNGTLLENRKIRT